MKTKFFIVSILLGVVILLSSAVFIRQNPQEAFLAERAELVVRQVGHQLLQYAGDSTSRVLPVRKLSLGVFQLEFESQFSFMPDTLVKITRTNLALIDLPVGYRVNVFECASHELIYGFEISPQHNEIVPCLGRVQPKGCYSIQISFLEFNSSLRLDNHYVLFILGLTSLSLIAFAGSHYLKKEKQAEKVTAIDGISIGKYSFSLSNQLLTYQSERIELSDKEAKLLSILAHQPNQLISREELLKRVWEDEGVFTGRSLDMFISKLRKKLKNDPSIQLTNVHSKGYKLEVS